MNPKVCEICQGLCRPLVSMNNPPASEWYCATDHKSYKMTQEEFRQWSQRMKPRG